jgi:hypothetical protein
MEPEQILPATREKDHLTDLTRPFALNDQVVFTSYPGGLGNDIEHSYHKITYLLRNDCLPLYFDHEHGQLGRPEHFKETYRLMYVTSPNFVCKSGGNPMPMPMPPFFGNFVGPVFGVGVCLNKSRASKAPAITPWLNLQDLKLYTQ